MSLVLAALLASADVPAPAPPPGLLFAFYRMVAFQGYARALGCGAADLDRDFDALRARLIKRYGKKPFSPPKPPTEAEGSCQTALSVYRINLADFREEAEAALAAPVPSPAAE
ncbi:hypothetical protein [Sphingosinicella sp. BN140058]|uniref:hypothetical protein n=1 Tax=Sphingosinicella sp. BN140058 TaxID=1892855 RepID=UPI001011E7AA|nr:hypothetical protein [Sphingosinicella sp. BN140058]QAY78429.1 hypothetical protein ETR14_19210 [Sphingosinicella sp. BN140058]